MELIREVKLIPQQLSLIFDKNKTYISLSYNILDILTNNIINNTHINFIPSKNLENLLKEEITNAIKNKNC